jgi:hypothetical protein
MARIDSASASYAATVTHEYVIATGGLILTGATPADPATTPAPTAIAWAVDRVLAVGLDGDVRAISRGDSTFLDLRGCVVTAAPTDIARAEAAAARTDDDLRKTLADRGLLPAGDILEAGSPADLAIWGRDRRIIAVVRAGAFTEGDAHTGPLPRVAP